MRVIRYLKEREISLNEINDLCEYLFLNELNVNSKLQGPQINLFDETLLSEEYKDWYLLKHRKIEDIEYGNALKLINHLSFTSKTIISEILGKRILNALNYLIEKNRFSDENKALIQNILKSDKSEQAIISDLRSCKLAKRKGADKIEVIDYDYSNDVLNNENNSNPPSVSYFDPYENFHWGGLSGEEAYTAYWNCE